MRAKIVALALPLIVLAGMRRCPKMHIDCGGCGSVGGGIPMTLILSSVVAAAAIAAYLTFKRRQAL